MADPPLFPGLATSSFFVGGSAFPALGSTSSIQKSIFPTSPSEISRASFHSFHDTKTLAHGISFTFPVRLPPKIIHILLCLIADRQTSESRISVLPSDILLPLLGAAFDLPHSSLLHGRLDQVTLRRIWLYLSENLITTRSQLAWWGSIKLNRPFVINDLSEINPSTISPAEASPVTSILTQTNGLADQGYGVAIRTPSTPVHVLKHTTRDPVDVQFLKRRARVLRVLSDEQSSLYHRRFLGIIIEAPTLITSLYEFLLGGKMLTLNWATLPSDPGQRVWYLGGAIATALAALHAVGEPHGALSSGAVFMQGNTTSALLTSFSMDPSKLIGPSAFVEDLHRLAELLLSLWAGRDVVAPPLPHLFPAPLLSFCERVPSLSAGLVVEQLENVVADCVLVESEAARQVWLMSDGAAELIANLKPTKHPSTRLLQRVFANLPSTGKATRPALLLRFCGFVHMFGPIDAWERIAAPVARLMPSDVDASRVYTSTGVILSASLTYQAPACQLVFAVRASPLTPRAGLGGSSYIIERERTGKRRYYFLESSLVQLRTLTASTIAELIIEAATVLSLPDVVEHLRATP